MHTMISCDNVQHLAKVDLPLVFPDIDFLDIFLCSLGHLVELKPQKKIVVQIWAEISVFQHFLSYFVKKGKILGSW